jgi:hypothetical protein
VQCRKQDQKSESKQELGDDAGGLRDTALDSAAAEGGEVAERETRRKSY